MHFCLFSWRVPIFLKSSAYLLLNSTISSIWSEIEKASDTVHHVSDEMTIIYFPGPWDRARDSSWRKDVHRILWICLGLVSLLSRQDIRDTCKGQVQGGKHVLARWIASTAWSDVVMQENRCVCDPFHICFHHMWQWRVKTRDSADV